MGNTKLSIVLINGTVTGRGLYQFNDTYAYVGGISGYSSNWDAIFESCYNLGSIFALGSQSQSLCGGITGGTGMGSTPGNTVMLRCFNGGNCLKSNGKSGAIARGCS